jgi:hypothetical protein
LREAMERWNSHVDELGLLYIALARLFDKPAEAVKLADEITSLAESLGVDGFVEFFKEAAAPSS